MSDETLVALTLMIASSKPEEKGDYGERDNAIACG